MMRLDPTTRFLIGKNLEQAIEPTEVLFEALLSAVVFGFIWYAVCFEIRQQSAAASLLIAVLLIVLCSAVALTAVVRYRLRRSSRPFFVAAVCMWGSLVAGYFLGDRFWYSHTVQYFTYGEMASYIGIDPDKDRGQSYMDAGEVYFKENSHVDTSRAIAFHNGLTYCVAPILRESLTQVALQTVNGFSPPPSGTVDFWAVGTNCCGNKGDTFTCGDTTSGLARSGMRILDDTARSMYLLAVQEWSATTGLPVRHPLFFRWVNDPIDYTESLRRGAWSALVIHAVICFGIALIAAAILHGVFRKFRIY